jgi:hypothetical protein
MRKRTIGASILKIILAVTLISAMLPLGAAQLAYAEESESNTISTTDTMLACDDVSIDGGGGGH